MTLQTADQTSDTVEHVPSTVIHKGSRRLATVILMIAVLGLVLGGWLIYSGLTDDSDINRVPDFTLPLITEEGDFTLSAYHGEIVLVNVWASWCVPCQEEAPMLESIYQDFRDKDVTFIGVAISDKEPDALAFIEEYGMTYPSAIDNDDLMEDLYHIYGVPVTFIVDKNGKMLQFYFSQPSESELRAVLEEAVG